jgi:hypothetical protein
MGVNYFMTYRVPQVKHCKQHHQIKADLYMYSCEYTPAFPFSKFVTVWTCGPAESLSRNTQIQISVELIQATAHDRW